MNVMTTQFHEEAEKAAIGAVLIHPGAMLDVRHAVSAEDFFLIRHAYIWTAMCALADRQQPIDVVTLAGELKSMGRLGDVTEAYLTQLMVETPSSAYASVYAGLVRKVAQRRKLLELTHAIQQQISDESQGVDGILQDASAKIQSLMGDDSPDLDFYDMVNNVVEDVMELWDHPIRAEGIPTGHRGLDGHTQGLHKKQLTYVASRPGMGKTTWLINMVVAALMAGKSVAMYTGEMSYDQLIHKIAAHLSSLATERVKAGKITLEEKKSWLATMAQLSKQRVSLWEGEVSPSKLKTKVLREKMRRGLDVLFVDYVGLLVADDRYLKSQNDKVSNISRGLKMLANTCDIPVVAAVQLNRDVEKRQDKRPQLSDLRDSGSLEQDADVVYALYRDAYYNKETESGNIIEINQLKFRHGEPQTFYGEFRPEVSRIVEGELRKVRLD